MLPASEKYLTASSSVRTQAAASGRGPAGSAAGEAAARPGTASQPPPRWGALPARAPCAQGGVWSTGGLRRGGWSPAPRPAHTLVSAPTGGSPAGSRVLGSNRPSIEAPRIALRASPANVSGAQVAGARRFAWSDEEATGGSWKAGEGLRRVPARWPGGQARTIVQALHSLHRLCVELLALIGRLEVHRPPAGKSRVQPASRPTPLCWRNPAAAATCVRLAPTPTPPELASLGRLWGRALWGGGARVVGHRRTARACLCGALGGDHQLTQR